MDTKLESCSSDDPVCVGYGPRGIWSQILSLVQDARRFTLRNRWSQIRIIYKNEEPSWMLFKPAVEAGWDACLQTFEGHDGSVNSVVFSPDSHRLASASYDKTIRVWDAKSGACLQILKSNHYQVLSSVFSPGSQRLASGSSDGTIKFWDANSGKCLQKFYNNRSVGSIAFDKTDDSHLITDHGVLKLDASIINTPPEVLSRDTNFHYYGIISDEAWITKE